MENRPIRVICCLPGNSYSGTFLRNWTTFIETCARRNVDLILSQQYSCNIYYSRNMCLGGSAVDGVKQKPFRGTVNYDYLLWVDSDIIFTFDQFEKLISHKIDIVSGLYFTESMRDPTYATVKDWNVDTYRSNGRFDFLKPGDITDANPFEVSYTGFGFMLIKKGVFENIEYPWFKPRFIDMGNDIHEFTMEDVTFCLEAKEAGYKIIVDPTVVVGHEKKYVIK